MNNVINLEEVKVSLEERIAVQIEKSLIALPKGRSTAKKHLKGFSPEAAARITLRHVVNGLVMKVNYKGYEKSTPSRLTAVLNKIGKDIDPLLNDKKQVHIGAFLFGCCIELNLVGTEEIKQGKTSIIYPERTSDFDMNMMVKKIYLVYPDQYEFDKWTEPYNNGVPIVKRLKLEDSHHYTYDMMPKVYKALNLLSDTEWAINNSVLDIMLGGIEGFTPEMVTLEEAQKARGIVACMERGEKSFADWVFEQDMISDTYDWSSPEAKRAGLKSRAGIKARVRFLEKSFDYNTVVSNYSKATRFINTLDYCMDHADKTMRFLHNLDSRGRVYSIMRGVDPQGSDAEKSLLQFKNGVKWSDTVARNLAIHTSNCAGNDKATFDDRELWTYTNMDNILEAYTGLKDGIATEWLSKFEGEKKTKWQLIAAILTWGDFQMAKDLGETHNFYVYISAGLDATTSGLQLLSIIGRDDTVAEHVNISTCSYAPVGDLYQVVGNKCHEVLHSVGRPKLVRLKEYSGLEHGTKLWRKLVKRGTMTYGYSCGASTMGKAVFFDKKDHNDEFVAGISYMESIDFGDLMFTSIEESLPKAAEIMRYLQGAVKEILAPQGSAGTISWTTASGFRAYQRYERCTSERVKVDLAGIRRDLTVNTWRDEASRAGHKLGIAANFIHSLDSALLINTICALGDLGHTNFHFIHDQFGLSMDGMFDINLAVREKMYDMFAYGCPLADFANENGVEITQPTKGGYDVEDILVSEYCFC